MTTANQNAWGTTVSQLKVATESKKPSIEPMVLRMKDLPRFVGLSRTAIYKQVKDGTFPRPVSLGGNAVGWRIEELKQWKANLRPI